MASKIDKLEAMRLELQVALDAGKTQGERNRLGQFATPTALAREIVGYGLSLLPKGVPVKFIDPAIGTGAFYSALLATIGRRRIACARGFDIDSHYGKPSRDLWRGTNLDIRIADFTLEAAPTEDADKSNLLICNPPYVRHHHLLGETKRRLQTAAKAAAHVDLSGLAGLYCYFLALSHEWMEEGGIAAWLIPSEFMDVNYGGALKDYLLREVTLLHIHRFDPNDVQFQDALVSSAIVWIRKQKPQRDHAVRFSYGGTMQKPTIVREILAADLRQADKWTRFPAMDVQPEHEGYRLGDLFAVKRGLATGDNSFFILEKARAEELQLPPRFLRPILPSARHIRSDEVLSDKEGAPILDRELVLLDCSLPEDEIRRDYPSLWAYLLTGLDNVAPRYLCRSRRYWYAQENRPAAPIVCTYIGRSDHDGRPFRFLLNRSNATATNVYLMLYPKPELAARIRLDPLVLPAIWRALNAIDRETLLGNGRVYGGGMHKMEPKELATVPADHLAEIAGLHGIRRSHQLELRGFAA